MLRRLLLPAALLGTTCLAAGATAHAYAPPSATVFISEIHYDNVGTDAGEAVEVFGPAGTSLTGWSIVLYNGSSTPAAAPSYDSDALSGTIPDLGGGFGVVVLSYPVNGIQNGTGDGIALVDNTNTVRQFLSYEGVITASNGPAAGLTSTDIGVAEAGSEVAGLSLQLSGAGTTYGALTWHAPATSSFGAINAGSVVVPDNCPNPPAVSPVHTVQGTTDNSPCAGETVVVEGVVVGDYEGPSPALRGFYVQEDDADVDADPATSEGVYVFNGADTNLVTLGDRVRVQGAVSEYQGQTEITLGTVTVLSSGSSVTPAQPTLPQTSAGFFERFEGMSVVFPQTLVVTEFFQLGRFGQVVVSANARLDQPTQVATPGAAAQALQAANDLERLIIDDTVNGQNPDHVVFGRGGNPLSASNTLRGGDTVTSATGVLTYTWSGNSASGNAFRLRPASAASPVPNFVAGNPRPASAPAVGGSLKVVGLNVLNYFLTLDVGTAANCGPAGNQQECRGAETAEEFQRQRTKLLQALLRLDADVYGLVELENTPNVDPAADLVAGLNTLTAPGTFASIDTGVLGNDAIRVGLIYRTAAVAPVGAFAVLDASVDPGFDTTRNRPALAQTFQQVVGGERLTVVVNHLKSKGSCPTALPDPNADQGDGQSCWNPVRTAAVTTLVDWLAGDPTGVADPDFLLLGDFNSYALEDPMQVFAGAGYVNLAEHFGGGYSYVFDGQWGTLDYAMASPSLVAQVTGAAHDHINADEPSVLDYNTNFKSAGQVASLYAPDEFRVSDHDPVVVGLQLSATPPPDVPETPVPVLLGLSTLALFGLHLARQSRRRAVV